MLNIAMAAIPQTDISVLLKKVIKLSMLLSSLKCNVLTIPVLDFRFFHRASQAAPRKFPKGACLSKRLRKRPRKDNSPFMPGKVETRAKSQVSNIGYRT